MAPRTVSGPTQNTREATTNPSVNRALPCPNRRFSPSPTRVSPSSMRANSPMMPPTRTLRSTTITLPRENVLSGGRKAARAWSIPTTRTNSPRACITV